MSTGPLLIPNIAAEEGAMWNAGEELLRDVGTLWAQLFSADATLLGRASVERESNVPELGAPRAEHEGDVPELDVPRAEREAAVFPELDRAGAFAWLHTPQAQQIALDQDRVLGPPDPNVVTRVHDKAFAVRAAESARLDPAELRDCIEVFEPEFFLAPGEEVLAALDERLTRWPKALERRFTLKPRFGSSGRGRLTARGDLRDLLPGLPRLAERGGAILEPWLDRVRDLSAQCWVEATGQVRLLGTLELLVSPAGVYRGHRGSVDNKGRVTSLCAEDEPLREAAAEIAVAAAAEGFSGPCSIDAFVYRWPGGEPRLRPVVEFNARFTMGTVAIGLLRRLLPMLRKRLPRDANERRAFLFSLAPPGDEWPRALGDDALFVPLTGSALAPRAGLVVGKSPGHLEMAFQPADSARYATERKRERRDPWRQFLMESGWLRWPPLSRGPRREP